MSTKSLFANWKTRSFSETQCYTVLVFLLLPVSYCIIQSESGIPAFFHGLLFFTGFIVFTFFEYVAHRFWMHRKRRPGKKQDLHMHHHTHPTELKITESIRNCLVVANALMVALAYWFDSYFTLFTGFYSGFVYYCFMHVFLHKPWAKKVFPLLQASHIHHHCKYPDRCFGISITWWDHLFNTAVSREVKITEKVLQFYFGKHAH